MIVDICPAVVEICKTFADKRIEGSQDRYWARGSNSIDKIRQDIFVGALAEWGTYEYLLNNDIKVNEPDMSIYGTDDKTFDCDLRSKDLQFHVKTQTRQQGEKFGVSWLCQRADKLLSDPSDTDVVVLTQVDPGSLKVDIKALVKARDLVDEELIGEPKIGRYRQTKVAIYLDDIMNSNINTWRLR